MFNFLLGPALDFIKSNYVAIITTVMLTFLFLISFYITMRSVKKLKTEVSPFYPFDIFFPQGGAWSIGYFLIAIIFLGALVFFMAKGNFSLGPA